MVPEKPMGVNKMAQDYRLSNGLSNAQLASMLKEVGQPNSFSYAPDGSINLHGPIVLEAIVTRNSEKLKCFIEDIENGEKWRREHPRLSKVYDFLYSITDFYAGR